MTHSDQSVSIGTPVVQRHKASGEVWRRVGRPTKRTVRIQREGVQRKVWLVYWNDRETWEPVG